MSDTRTPDEMHALLTRLLWRERLENWRLRSLLVLLKTVVFMQRMFFVALGRR